MVNKIPKGVSQNVANAVKLIKQMDGSKKKIDSQVEYAQLQELLNKTTGEKNRSYIQGLMVEYEKTAPTAKTEKADKEHFNNSISKEAKKNIDNLCDVKKLRNSGLGDTQIRLRVKDFYMKQYPNLSDEEKTYFDNRIKKSFPYMDLNKPETINIVEIDPKEAKEIGKKAGQVRELLRGNNGQIDNTGVNMGITVKAEQQFIADIIMNDINSDNVFEFLNEYNYHGFNDGEGLFEQLISEYNFPDKGKLIEKLSTDLKEHMEKYGYDNARNIEVLKADKAKYNAWDSFTDWGGVITRSNGGYYAVKLDEAVRQEMLLRRDLYDYDYHLKEVNKIKPE